MEGWCDSPTQYIVSDLKGQISDRGNPRKEPEVVGWRSSLVTDYVSLSFSNLSLPHKEMGQMSLAALLIILSHKGQWLYVECMNKFQRGIES